MKTELDFDSYCDRIHAAWLGKSIGGAVGAALENHKELKNLPSEKLWPDDIPANDDMDIQIVWFEALLEKGPYLTQKDLVYYWQDRCWYHFCEYGFFLYNVQRGIMPPLSGRWGNDFFSESEGCPIRSDIWGLVCPGNVELAAAFAEQDGELDHINYSVHAEMFFSAMTAKSLVGGTQEEIIESALSVLPSDSPVIHTVKTVQQIHNDISDYSGAWRVLMRQFGDRDASKAVTNLAIVVLAYLRSRGDFREAMRLCANSGWDTDCTAATLGAILGAWQGTACIPDDWRQKLPPDLFCAVEIEHKNMPLTQLSYETALLGVEMSLCRNDKVSIINAPEVKVRQKIEPVVEITAKYPENPVLFSQKTTHVILDIENFAARDIDGILKISVPENIICEPSEISCCVPYGGKFSAELAIRRRDTSLPLPDKNLFTAEFITDGQTFSEKFGLAGARQWLVYGPYWTMYNVEKYGENCPYLVPETKHPASVGCNIDSYMNYQYLDFPYLDEETLAIQDLPQEIPYQLEAEHDLIRENQMGKWHGSCCRYLVREFIIPEGRPIYLNLGRTGYLKVWLDGREICRSNELHSWMLGDSDVYSFTATGKKQRLVVKYINPADEAALAVYFHLGGKKQPKRGVSYLTDELINIVPEGYFL